jgi:hypothetical protein
VIITISHIFRMLLELSPCGKEYLGVIGRARRGFESSIPAVLPPKADCSSWALGSLLPQGTTGHPRTFCQSLSNRLISLDHLFLSVFQYTMGTWHILSVNVLNECIHVSGVV